MIEPMLYGAIEGGGTKFLCAVYTAQREVVAQERIPTSTPKETLEACTQFFLPFKDQVAAFGIANFGPLETRATQALYGSILATPKPGWSGTDLRASLRQAGFTQPMRVDTDVNGAVLAEAAWGAGQGCENLVYFTIGTGIGGGALLQGQVLHGAKHPEMGHMRLKRLPEDAAFSGICPFHGDCLEGLASGPAMAARWGKKAEDLPSSHPAWTLEVAYLAQMLQNTLAVLAPERIILGGGIGSLPFLLPRLREKLNQDLGGYWPAFDPYSQVLGSGLKEGGLLGALALALAAEDPDTFEVKHSAAQATARLSKENDFARQEDLMEDPKEESLRPTEAAFEKAQAQASQAAEAPRAKAGEWVEAGAGNASAAASEAKEDLHEDHSRIREEAQGFVGSESQENPSQGSSWGRQARREVDQWLDQASKDLKVASAEVKEWAQKTQQEFQDAVENKPEDPANPNMFKELGRTVKDIGENLKDFFDGEKTAGK